MASVDEALAHVKEAEFLAAALGGWVFFEGDDVHGMALWEDKRRGDFFQMHDSRFIQCARWGEKFADG
jgi:hypothetical protein